MARLLAAAALLTVLGLTWPSARVDASDLRPRDLRILAERHTDGQSGTFVVHGDGTGIWNHRLQFRVSPPDLDRLSRAVESARFRDMPDTFGRGRKWLVRRVAVQAGGLSKQVVQIRGGERSKDLEELTDQLFEIVSPLAQEGVSARTLQDGLRKVASGDLAPQGLLVIVHVKPAPGQDAPGFLVKIEDGRATRQEYRDGVYSETMDLALTPEALRHLAGILADANPDALPANLHSEVYTELVVSVLDRRKTVLARSFTGPAPAGQYDSHERFLSLFARMSPLLAPRSGSPSKAPIDRQ